MSHTRRHFIRNSAALAAAFSLNKTLEASLREERITLARAAANASPEALSRDEDFWAQVRQQFTVNPGIINLNNGGVCPQPKSVQEAHIRNYEFCNQGPSYWMWRVLDQGREALRQKLARLAGCDPEELAINRNATEGLNTVIFGLNLKAGDEVVLSRYDYPNMINAWKQREKREGIKLVWVDLDLPITQASAAVEAYAAAITERTRVVHVTHVINWTGQVMPARAIADMAHARGCLVIVDGAHSFAHIAHQIPDTGADFYATSLHKWLLAPFGSGLLYIRKDKIQDVWALLSNDKPDGDNIRKFESLGTRSFASEMAISEAIDFHWMLGDERKQARLHYLKEYWTREVARLDGVRRYTSPDPAWSCAIANVGLEGWKATEIDAKLFEISKIHVVGIEWEQVSGIRVTPNVYTALKELDVLVESFAKIARMENPNR